MPDGNSAALAITDIGRKKRHQVDEHVGSRIRLRRIMVGMSQQRLARIVGVTTQQIQKYEKGINRISSGRLFQISQVLRVPVDFFFDSVGRRSQTNQSKIADGPGSAASSEERREKVELVKAYYQIEHAALRRSVIRLMNALRTEPSGSDP
jgi:transcriptional regulator with XRE-family HTH domain